jgi:hypothetical protein
MTWQLMRTARTLEAEWWQVLRGSLNTGAEEVESSTGSVWTAGIYHVTARSHLSRVLKHVNSFISLIFSFFSGCDKPRILNQQIRGRDCTSIKCRCIHWPLILFVHLEIYF